LTSLTILYLDQNQISDIAPLVSNAGLATGDTVDLRSNPLSPSSVNVYIPALQARGVTVFWDEVAPDWRKGIQPGDILYDEGSIFIPVILPPIPPTIISIGHTGMYVRSGITIEADSSGVLYRDISSWDKPQRKNVYLLRVNCSQ
jgi:hypothetical protein